MDISLAIVLEQLQTSRAAFLKRLPGFGAGLIIFKPFYYTAKEGVNRVMRRIDVAGRLSHLR
jgi:hypothetical protein